MIERFLNWRIFQNPAKEKPSPSMWVRKRERERQWEEVWKGVWGGA